MPGDDAIRSEVLCIAVAHEMEGERAHLVVDCRQGRVTLKAKMTWRSQADILLARVRAVEGIAELDDDLTWELDDTYSAALTLGRGSTAPGPNASRPGQLIIR